MTANDEGFLYPFIDEKLCNDCGRCRRTCPVNNAIMGNTRDGASKTENDGEHIYRAYACYAKNDNVRLSSTSGGAFSQLAMKVLSNGGVVFGAGFDENFNVRHCGVEDENGLESLRRSKYVQSHMGNTFSEAEAFLKKGRNVLFCGTPCQIAGLKAYLKKDYNNLLTCDLACHGVPSPMVWSMYLDYLKNRFKSNIKSVSFRDKSTGWNSSSMKIVFENGAVYMHKVKDEIFFMGFGKSIFNRMSCYNCRFRLSNSKADLTLADFWGIDRQAENGIHDNKGVSLVITHNKAGEDALFQLREEMYIREHSTEEAVKYNPRLISSVNEPAGRKRFFADLSKGYSFDRLRRKYMDNESLKYRLKCMAKRILGRA